MDQNNTFGLSKKADKIIKKNINIRNHYIIYFDSNGSHYKTPKNN